MKAHQGNDYFQFYSNRSDRALDDEKYEDALDPAIKGYLIAKEMGDQKSRQEFLALLEMIFLYLLEKDGEMRRREAKHGDRCSFCMRTEDEATLMVGWAGSICPTCAAEIHEVFTRAEPVKVGKRKTPLHFSPENLKPELKNDENCL